jgi:hypothetical protein
MLIEIGLVIAFYSIARLLPDRLARVRMVANGVALLVAVLVASDLVHRGFFDKSALERFVAGSAPPAASMAPSPKSKAEITKVDGGSITTNLKYGIAVAKGSSLRREWIAINYADMPVTLQGTPGVTTVYVSKEYGGDFQYAAKLDIVAAVDISAYEIRFLTFDVWGNHVRTLSMTGVEDIASGTKKHLVGAWNVYSENEVEEHYASIAFVAKARLKDGRVVAAPIDAVVEEARRFSAKFAEKDVEPAAPTKGS